MLVAVGLSGWRARILAVPAALGVRVMRGGYAVCVTLACSFGAAQAACPPTCTPAGTTITNIATVRYTTGGTNFLQDSSPTISFRVDEVIGVTVTGPAGPTSVNSPDTNRPLVFTVTNTGNAPEAFNLIANQNPGAPIVDQFNPVPGSVGLLFIDVNRNGQLDIGVDTPVAGPVTIAPSTATNPPLQVLVVSNIPAGLVAGNQGVVTLTAASATVGAVVGGVGAPTGTVLPNAGTTATGAGGIDAIVGAGRGGATDSGADDTASGAYVIGAGVTIAKSIIAVTSPFGVTTTGCNGATPPAACAVFQPGTVIQYQLVVVVTGSGTVQSVLVSDDIPANTTYAAGSLRVNGVARTDAADGDNASCANCGSATGTLTVNLGDVPVTPAIPVTHLIDYKVSIN